MEYCTIYVYGYQNGSTEFFVVKDSVLDDFQQSKLKALRKGRRNDELKRSLMSITDISKQERCLSLRQTQIVSKVHYIKSH